MSSINTNTSSVRHGSVDLLKHLFALVVVFMHMRSQSRYSPEVNSFILHVQDYVDGAVMGFFMIAGFFFKPAKKGQVGEVGELAMKLLKRLGVPYLIFSVIYALAMYGLGKQSLISSVEDIVSLRGAAMQLYFLPYLFIVTMLFAIPVLLVGVKYNAVTQIVSLIAVVGLGVALMMPTNFSTGADLRMFPIYLGCYALGNLIAIFLNKKPSSFWAFGLSSSALALVVGLYDKRFYDVAAVLILLMIALMLSLKHLVPHRNYPGSGGVYLLHTPIINFSISAILMKFGIVQYSNLFVALLLTYVVCLMITMVLIRILGRNRYLILE